MRPINKLSLLIVSISFALFILGCERNASSAPENANEPGAGEYAEEAADAIGEAIEDVGEEVLEGAERTVEAVGAVIDKEIKEINALGLTMRNLIGEEVHTQKGDRVAIIDDVLLDEQGRPELLVIKEGGLLGAGDDIVIISAQRFIVKHLENREIAVEISMNEDELERLGEDAAFLPADFSAGAVIETDLLSGKKLLEKGIYNAQEEKVGEIYDFILGADWAIAHVVISLGGLKEFGDRLVAAPWRTVSLNQERTHFNTTSFAPDFDALEDFSYDRREFID